MNHAPAANTPSLTRRKFLSTMTAVSALSALQFPAGAFAAGMEPPDFLAFSEKLTRQEGLDQDIASVMLKAFSGLGRGDDIAAMVAGDTDDDDLANAIVSAWYTGESPDPEDLDVLTYTDALVWQAVDFSKPMASCGGGMGYWSDPPEG
ncbi:sugar dehydrogenase complex small subunit [Salipiger mucosus]|uniref:Uncharacterized protein n=1 Tax=Salipiger mucosus DSM 16094 TaxID=1123237 RepID=S9S047_9RHOB|nr:sugar dehydrogenase complex small subunit [Salipiger mucosus]EPX83580.1 hypothetical protein Salmuc_02188 [Salipiger mucosus DSM 16094]